MKRRTRRQFALGAAAAAFTGRALAAAEGTFEVTRTEDEWKKILTADQFYVLREQGTERAGSSPLNKEKRKGTYLCAGCALPGWRCRIAAR